MREQLTNIKRNWTKMQDERKESHYPFHNTQCGQRGKGKMTRQHRRETDVICP